MHRTAFGETGRVHANLPQWRGPYLGLAFRFSLVRHTCAIPAAGNDRIFQSRVVDSDQINNPTAVRSISFFIFSRSLIPSF